MAKKPHTEKQKAASARNWQILRLKGAIEAVKTNELIREHDKDIIISLLNNSLINSKIKFNNLTLCSFKGVSFYMKNEKPSPFQKLKNKLKVIKRKKAIDAIRNIWRVK